MSIMDYKENHWVNPGTNKDRFFFCRDVQQAGTYSGFVMQANDGLENLAKISKVQLID